MEASHVLNIIVGDLGEQAAVFIIGQRISSATFDLDRTGNNPVWIQIGFSNGDSQRFAWIQNIPSAGSNRWAVHFCGSAELAVDGGQLKRGNLIIVRNGNLISVIRKHDRFAYPQFSVFRVGRSISHSTQGFSGLGRNAHGAAAAVGHSAALGFRHQGAGIQAVKRAEIFFCQFLISRVFYPHQNGLPRGQNRDVGRPDGFRIAVVINDVVVPQIHVYTADIGDFKILVGITAVHVLGVRHHFRHQNRRGQSYRLQRSRFRPLYIRSCQCGETSSCRHYH